MSPTIPPEPPGFTELSKAEQVQYTQDLWDRIADQPETLPVPESHLVLAGERLAEYQPDTAPSAYAVLARLGHDRPCSIG
ncbi:MAG: addiction module protein [Pseudanabaenaceae cyanobacterium]